MRLAHRMTAARSLLAARTAITHVSTTQRLIGSTTFYRTFVSARSITSQPLARSQSAIHPIATAAPCSRCNCSLLVAPRLPSSSTPSSSSSLRSLHTRSTPLLHNSTAIEGGSDVHVVFVTAEGERFPVVGKEGENLLALAHANDVELEGACEASLACSTCHVILPDEYYSKLPEPVDEENDMLDLAFGLTDTSRLGCQVKLTKDLEGMEIMLPSATRNMAVDGHKPKPH